MRIKLSEDSAATIARFPNEVRNEIRAELLRLSENPATLSRPSVMPFPAGYQMYQFRVEYDGDIHFFTVLFRYGDDEETLIIPAIGHVRYNPGDGDE